MSRFFDCNYFLAVDGDKTEGGTTELAPSRPSVQPRFALLV